MKYNHKQIESKWQRIWEESGIYKDYSKKKKFYALDMFPYPSGAGLHVGHPKGYIATDVYSRFVMLHGYSVLHPMGWDAFGLPAENYAIENKIHPRVAVEKNIATFKKQLLKFGFTYDWAREINTTDPEYYKWTQWIFLKMFEHGLVYQSDEPINWCPKCKTGLALEDLEGGYCERCGTQVVQKKMRQWVLKMTEYADRLLSDLDSESLDWEEQIKEQQKNWIGRSEGVEFQLPIVIASAAKQSRQGALTEIASSSRDGTPRNDMFINVYTTRIDTVFGMTYVVVAPEHEIIEKLKDKIENYNEVEKYLIKAQNKTDLERMEMKEKSGIELKGIKAANPFNNEEAPIFVADYVLGGYGTGAVMAVPAHDKRDFEFAIKNNLPIRQVVKPKDIFKSVVVASTVENGFKEELEKNKIIFNIGLSRNKREHIRVDLTKDQIKQYIKLTQKYLKSDNWVEIIGAANIFIFKSEVIEDFFTREKEIFERCKNAEPLVRYQHNLWEMLEHNLFYEGWVCFESDGILINSEKYSGLTSEEARKKMTEWLEKNKLGGKKVNYKMRDWVFSRQRYWGEPFPLVFCEHCAEKIRIKKSKIKNSEFSIGEILNPGWIAIPEGDLPIKLPDIESYAPTGTGEGPLANIKEWVNTKCPKCGGPAKRETNTMPQWAGSSWYYLRYIDPRNKKILVDKQKEKEWMPVDLYVGGAEHATRHLLYARFWHKFLHDIGAVSTKEPFKRLIHVGLINGEDGRKMSKRWGNVINPDDIIEKFGADSIRLYEMFMGPFTQNIAWSTKGVVGVSRFLDRVWRLYTRIATNKSPYAPFIKGGNANSHKLNSLLHKTIKKVTEDIESFKFNTAISQMMIFVNELEKKKEIPIIHYSLFLILLSPFAPHLAEELWSKLGHHRQSGTGKESIFKEKWPEYDKNLIKDEMIKLVIQINGKVRDMIEADADVSEEEAKKLALASEKVKKWIKGSEVKKVIFVKRRLINLVV